jgi:hypothetical protein
MGTYKARVFSSDKRFHNMPLLFDSSIAVSDNTKLVWLEPLKDGANAKEKEWHTKVSKLVVQDG